MRNVNFYIDAARAAKGLTSDRQLDKWLGFSGSPTCHWRTHRALPAPETMVHLAELAGVDPIEGLLDLGRWQAVSKRELRVAEVYIRALNLVQRAASIAAMLVALLVSFGGTSHAQNTTGLSELYIMRQHLVKKIYP